MFSAIFILFLLPWLDTSKVRSARYRPLFRQFFALFIIDCLLLGYLGAMPAEGIYVVLARVGTVYYFAHFLIILPVLGIVEKPKKCRRVYPRPFGRLGTGSRISSRGTIR